MTSENKTILITRTKSFLWRLGAYIAVAVLSFILENIGLFNLPEVVVVIVALIVGEITKYINVNLRELKKA